MGTSGPGGVGGAKPIEPSKPPSKEEPSGKKKHIRISKTGNLQQQLIKELGPEDGNKIYTMLMKSMIMAGWSLTHRAMKRAEEAAKKMSKDE